MNIINYIIYLVTNPNSDLFEKLYSFTTENISGYFPYLSFKDKKILTVTASGDQALNAILFGSKEIDCFDTNPLAKYYLELKLAAIKELNQDEYLAFFCHGDSCFQQEVYNKLRKSLSSFSLEIWDQIFSTLKGPKIKEALFSVDEYNREKVVEFNPYLHQFSLLKSQLSSVTIHYYDVDIKQLPFVLKSQYDTMILSNIMQYAENIYEKNSLEQFKKLLIDLQQFLKEDGKIMCNYLYHFATNNLEHQEKEMVFKEEYEYVSFKGIRDQNDGAIIFSK